MVFLFKNLLRRRGQALNPVYCASDIPHTDVATASPPMNRVGRFLRSAAEKLRRKGTDDFGAIPTKAPFLDMGGADSSHYSIADTTARRSEHKEGGPLPPWDADTAASAIPTPLTFNAFAEEARSATSPDAYDGFRLDFSRPLWKQVQLTNSLHLSSSGTSPFHFSIGPTFEYGPGSVMFGRVDTDGALSARAAFPVGPCEMKVQASGNVPSLCRMLCTSALGKRSKQAAEEEDSTSAVEVGLDRTGSDYSITSRIVRQGAWILNGSYTQTLSPRLQAGTELIWVSSNGASIGSVGARYDTKKDVFTAIFTRQPNFKVPGAMTSSLHSIRLSHSRAISPRLTIASEFETAIGHPIESSLKTGYTYNFKQARLTGVVDSTGTIAMTMMDHSGIGVSAVADLVSSKYQFGISMQLSLPN